MIADLTTCESAPSAQGGPYAYVSASRLSCWLGCGLRWRLRYIDGIKSPPSPAMFLGKAVHASLEIVNRHRQLGIVLGAEDVARRLAMNWDRWAADEHIAFRSVAEEQTMQQQTLDLVSAYLAQVPKDEKPLAVEVTAEAPLVDPATGEDLGMPLLGVMDLLVDNEEGPVIVDYKTVARSTEPLEVSHEIQLTGYSYLLRQVHPRAESAIEIRSLVKTKTPKIECHRYAARTDNHFRRLFAVIRAYLDDLDAKRFIFRPGFGCAACEFCSSHCARWSGCS